MTTQVYDLLITKGNAVNIQGKDYVIRCLNPEHEDLHPSMRIDQIDGRFKCVSCGFKGNIFKHYNILSNNISIKTAHLMQKLTEIKTMTTGLDLPENSIPFNKVFRGVSLDTLKHFEAFTTPSVEKLEDRLVFPLRNVLGKIQAFVGRHMLSNANPKYVNYPSHIRLPLYPPVLPKNSESMVLVEGIFDMLNLYDKGLLNSVCTFGTTTLLGDPADKLLPYKVQGVSKIYIMFDGDDPGRRAAKQLKPLLEKCEFEVEIIDLEDDVDPGTMSEEEIQETIEYIKSRNTNLAWSKDEESSFN